MADVDTGGGGGGRGKKGGSKTKKKSTKIDMTAMVDVAFLLLTFFVLTAVIQDYSIMALTMPPKDDQNLKRDDLTADVDEEKVVTIVLGEKDTVHYFHRITDVEIEHTTFDPETGVAKVIQEHLRRYPKLCKEEKEKYGKETEGCWDPIFIIKSKKTAKYRNLVDILDEMSIQGAPKYAIDVFTARDSLMLLEKWDFETGAPIVE